MSWKNVTLPSGAKMFQVLNFTYMHKGTTYHLEIDEFADGTWSGHGEHSTDKSSVLPSVSGSSLQDCLDALVKTIETK